MLDLDSFLQEINDGVRIPNKALLARIKQIPHDSDYEETLSRLLTSLAVARPTITNLVRISRRTEWYKYMKANDVNINHSTMALCIKLLAKTKINPWILTLYEEDYPQVREVVHLLNAQTGTNKVPYIHVCLRNLGLRLINKDIYKSTAVLRQLFDHPQLISTINEYIANDTLKKICGETTTNLSAYLWMKDGFDVDTDAIQRADVGYDLGGGYSTPVISTLFNRSMVSLDIISPSSHRENDISFGGYSQNFNIDEYHQKLDKQEWINFNVYEDSFSLEHNSYFITSFGFATSTVNTPTVEGSHATLTTYWCCRRVAELVAAGKDVYFIFYGRPSSKVYRNKIISMRFVDRQLQYVNIFEDDYSLHNEHNFGTRSQLDGD